jgi:2-amino-4-hydroxy-6-hydroxymethyldihydropteridine diphosphokinase
MTKVTLSLGSNINPVFNLMQAINSLEEIFDDVQQSSVYESKAIGFDGDNFLNLVALIDTDMSLGELVLSLKTIEDQQGRDRQALKLSGRTLDIDVLTYGDVISESYGVCVPRPEITENAFVLLPLAELMPKEIHPLLGRTYQELWADYDQSSQQIWKVDFDWKQI